MVNPFGDIDFSLLDNPEFGEDAVREELIAPLLRALGYLASPPYQIIRSRKLEHPFVYFGTVKKDITIIPDYVLERDGRPAWILDAKSPREAIDTGKNVEQAFHMRCTATCGRCFMRFAMGAASRYGTYCTTSR
jgi:predicted type IV restriction endonuclease